MEQGTISTETHKYNRVAYKGKFIFWRIAAFVMFAMWAATMVMFILEAK